MTITREELDEAVDRVIVFRGEKCSVKYICPAYTYAIIVPINQDSPLGSGHIELEILPFSHRKMIDATKAWIKDYRKNKGNYKFKTHKAFSNPVGTDWDRYIDLPLSYPIDNSDRLERFKKASDNSKKLRSIESFIVMSIVNNSGNELVDGQEIIKINESQLQEIVDEITNIMDIRNTFESLGCKEDSEFKGVYSHELLPFEMYEEDGLLKLCVNMEYTVDKDKIPFNRDNISKLIDVFNPKK